MEILEDSLVNANDISIMIEKEFTVECCVVMYTKANGKQKSTVNGKLVTKQDLVQLYKISMQWRWITKDVTIGVGHVPKFL